MLYKKLLMLLTGVLATGAIAACSEKLEGGASCPILCTQQAVELRDTTIDGVSFDTTIVGIPSIGNERFLMLAAYGDSLDSRAIVRFDTITQSYSTTDGGTNAITQLDSAFLLIPIQKPDTVHRPAGPITIEAYNVDSIPPDGNTLPTDTVSSVIASLFRPGRLLGSKTFSPESLLDTLVIPLPTDTVFDRVTKGTRLRIGLRLVASQGFHLALGSSNVSAPVTLKMVASTDTTASPVLVTPYSNTPANQTFLSGPLADYSIIVRGGMSTVPAGLLSVGGVPSRRTLIRFDVPPFIVDSTTIVRASLQMTQVPNHRVAPTDTVYVFPSALLAQATVTDVRNLLQFVSTIGTFGLDSVAMAPGDSGQKSFEIVGLVRTWKSTTADLSPHAIALSSNGEGGAPGQIDFVSSRAGGAQRPRLRITYAPQTTFGLP